MFIDYLGGAQERSSWNPRVNGAGRLGLEHSRHQQEVPCPLRIPLQAPSQPTLALCHAQRCQLCSVYLLLAACHTQPDTCDAWHAPARRGKRGVAVRGPPWAAFVCKTWRPSPREAPSPRLAPLWLHSWEQKAGLTLQVCDLSLSSCLPRPTSCEQARLLPRWQSATSSHVLLAGWDPRGSEANRSQSNSRHQRERRNCLRSGLRLVVRKMLCSYIDQPVKATERDRPALSQTCRTGDLEKARSPHTQPSVAVAGPDDFSSDFSSERRRAVALPGEVNSACTARSSG